MIGRVKEFSALLRYWRNHPLASKDLRGTILRFIQWQMGSRLLRAPILWPWIGSTKLIVETGMTGATMNIYCGLHEFADMAFLLHLLRPEDRFVDIGANVGSYTILASGAVGARSLCVEPIPSTFKKLSQNIAVNNLCGLARAECCGVGSQDGILRFVADQDTMNRVAPEGYIGHTLEVPVRTLDNLLSGFPAILWKVDVEGFEEEVLAGAANALRSESLLAVEMEGDSHSLRATMSSYGFNLYSYDPLERELTRTDDKRAGHNWLWIRDPRMVSERCQTAKRTAIGNVLF